MDRIDSLTAAIPVFVLGAQLSGWLDLTKAELLAGRAVSRA